MKAAREHSAETQFANLARMVRGWADGDLVDGQAGARAADWLALERALDRRRPAGRVRRVEGMLALAASAAVALLLARSFGGGEARLSFVVSEGAVAPAGGDAPLGRNLASSGQPARVSFSDGSNVVMQPGARGTVVATTARGARVRMEEGRARFAVAHRPRTDWSVEAGPFLVVVHGTVFDVDWSGPRGALAVDLISGTITVKGPVPGGQVTLQAGHRLTAFTSAGRGPGHMQVQVQVEPRPFPPPETPAPAAPAATPAPAGAAAAPLPLVPADGAAPLSRLASLDGGARPRRRLAPAPLSVRENASASSGRGMPVGETWATRVAAGAFQSVVSEADAAGVERCLAEASVGALAALADAARYVRRTDLARRALLAERRRFAATRAAHDAAFLIGRLADDASRDPREALLWYDRYLEEAEQGTYTSEALGRKMLALDRLGADADAHSAAAAYLKAYPQGAFATRARRLRDQP